jgi:hypothetical protein
VTSDAAFAFLPSWSADGRTLLYSRDVDGPRYHAGDRNSAVECAAVREDPGSAADVCPAGPAPSELYLVGVDGGPTQRVFGDLGGDAADGAW